MPSALYSSNYSATANNILNKFDNSPIYNSSTGAWSFKNSSGTEVLSVSGSGVVLGSGTFSTQTHEVKGNISSGGTGTTDESRTIVIGANYSSSGVQGPLTTRTTSLSGTFIRMTPRTSNSSIGFSVNTNLVTSGTETNIAYATVAGAWTFPINTTHTFGVASGSSDNTLEIRSGTGKKSSLYLICTTGYTWSTYSDDGDNGTFNISYLQGGIIPFKIDRLGVVTLGASGAGAHTAQASATGVGTVLIVNNLTDATNAASIRFRDNGSTMGSVGSSTSYPLRVTSSTDTEVFLVPAGLGNGTLTLTSNVVGISSDARLKTLTENQNIPGLNAICNITPARYTWKNPAMGDDVHLGFIAQDVQPHIPEAVGKPGEDGMLGFYDRPVLAAVVKAIQELSAKLDSAYAEIAALKSA